MLYSKPQSGSKSMVKLHTLQVGACTHPGCLAVKGAAWAPTKFPAKAYLLETKNGFLLWDTGYSQHFLASKTPTSRIYKWVTPIQYDDAKDSLLGQLSAKGLRPSDIREIHISHFHADHVAGLKNFPASTFWASADALATIDKLKGAHALLKGHLPELLPEDFKARARGYAAHQWGPLPPKLAPFSKGWALEPMGELFVVPLPGHAAGHVGLFVLTEAGWVLLASDACWSHSGYERLVGPSELSFLIQDDRVAYYETLKQLHELHLRGVTIYLTHA